MPATKAVKRLRALPCAQVASLALGGAVRIHFERDGPLDPRASSSTLDCTGSDGIDIHGLFPSDEGWLPATDIGPQLTADETARGHHTLLHLERDGIASGHAESLVLRDTELQAADGWPLELTARLSSAGLELLQSRHMPSRCARIVGPTDSQGRPSYSSFYSNALHASRGGRLLRMHTPAGAPNVAAPSWLVDDGRDERPPSVERRATPWHRDGGDENVLVLWFPVLLAAGVRQWPLVWANTSMLRGLRTHQPCASLPQRHAPSVVRSPSIPSPSPTTFRSRSTGGGGGGTKTSSCEDADEGSPAAFAAAAAAAESAAADFDAITAMSRPPVELLFWGGMRLGDYLVFDGMRTFHASGRVEGVDATTERTALSITYMCEPHGVA
jgi:hypothetical protein